MPGRRILFSGSCVTQSQDTSYLWNIILVFFPPENVMSSMRTG